MDQWSRIGIDLKFLLNISITVRKSRIKGLGCKCVCYKQFDVDNTFSIIVSSFIILVALVATAGRVANKIRVALNLV